MMTCRNIVISIYRYIDRRPFNEGTLLGRPILAIAALVLLAGCFTDRNFDGLDLLLFPEGPAGAYEGFKKGPGRKIVEAFLARGGRIIACEEAAAALPQHPGVIAVPGGGSLLKAAVSQR